MNYYITQRRDNVFNAGSKAPGDVNAICSELGWEEVPLVGVRRKDRALKKAWSILRYALSWAGLTVRAGKGSAVLYQHPMYFGTKICAPFLRLMRLKGINTIVLIHDIEHLRAGEIKDATKQLEIDFLKFFEYVVCHNYRMREYLAAQGVDERKLVELGIFDYLVDECADCLMAGKDNLVEPAGPSVIVAGNLDAQKCSYIYEMASSNPDVHISLYGIGYEDQGNVNISYEGSFAPEKLPSALRGDYGVVWDGNSIESCAGPMGDYLLYNNPHKLSLYLCAGIPAIVWKKSAVARFVEENECGILVDELTDIKEEIAKVPEAEHARMRESCARISHRMRRGAYFKDALQRMGIA